MKSAELLRVCNEKRLVGVAEQIRRHLPEHSGFPNTCFTTVSESEISAAQPKSIILTFGNGPLSRRRF